MLHILQYDLKKLIRNREELFWVIVFPILLGSLFKIAFSNITAMDSFHAIPVAVVSDGSEEASQFETTAEELDLLDAVVCDEEKALKLLKKKKIDGIIYAGDSISLSISANQKQASINQSILESFTTQYNMNQAIIADAAINHPDKLADIIDGISKEHSFNKEVSLSKRDVDPFSSYFYNLIAMSCLFSAMAGIYISTENQSNLSALAARKNVAPTHKVSSIAVQLVTHVLFQFAANLIGYIFIVLVLKIDLTAHLWLAFLTIFMSCLAGTSLGFFVGAIGKMKENTKVAMIAGVDMALCFLSGLMLRNMRVIIDTYCPMINRINPAAIIADCFYSLTVLDNVRRFSWNILSLFAMAVIFCTGGFLLTRRKTYASL